jgi:trans-feruloyl-CoA hydratase/vanillin synthase
VPAFSIATKGILMTAANALAPSSYDNVLVEIADHVAWITLNRPDKRNAISPGLSTDMVQVLRAVNANPEVRVLVLTGAGASFCAGVDLKEVFRDLADKPEQMALFHSDARGWMWEGITRSPKPVIAMVNGFCFGGGFAPLLASDIAVAGSEAVFGLSEINWGHFLGGAVSKLVVQAMGRRMAAYYTLTGERIDAQKAQELGLVTFAVPQSELKQRVSEIAQVLVAKSAIALQTNKEVMRITPDMSIDQCYEYALAKSDQLRVRDTGDLRVKAREDFVANKKFRPGMETAQI